MLAKIIVSHNECEFYVYGGIRVCAEVPREGPILVLDVFRLAMENNTPAASNALMILMRWLTRVLMCRLERIGTYSREVQRILFELSNYMFGFESS